MVQTDAEPGSSRRGTSLPIGVSVTSLAQNLARRSRRQARISICIFLLIIAVSSGATDILLFPNQLVSSNTEASAERAQHRLERRIGDDQRSLAALRIEEMKPVIGVEDHMIALLDHYAFAAPPDKPSVISGDDWASWENAEHFNVPIMFALGSGSITQFPSSASLASYISDSAGLTPRVDATYSFDRTTKHYSTTSASIRNFADFLAKQKLGLPVKPAPLEPEIERVQAEIYGLQDKDNSVKQLLTQIQAGVSFDVEDNRPLTSNDLIQANLLRLAAFSIASIVIYFLTSLYRFHARVAVFLQSRSDALSLVTTIRHPDIMQLGEWLSPAIDFGRQSGTASRDFAMIADALTRNRI